MDDNEKLKPGAIVAERFRLERQLGQGGMGAVWLAQHLGLDISCAVKFLRRDAAASADLRGRFEREAKGAAKLKSQHVVQILDHGVWDGTPFIAMEYLEGEDLNRRLRRLRRLDPRETVRIASQVARALAKAHQAGLVHRDLKPSNIFLVRDDDQEVAKVLDFGVAKQTINSPVASDDETRTGSLLGTPQYMSPEQAQGIRTVDYRSDLWSLAVVVFQCVTGQLPFKSDALGDLLVQIIVNPPPIPSQVVPLPQSFDTWWLKAVSREPADRFQSAREFATTLATAFGIPVVPHDAAGEGASIYVPPATPSDASWPRTPPPASISPPSTPMPTPISSARFDVPPSAGPSAGPTVNFAAASVSIAESPRKPRPRIVVVLAAAAGIAIGGIVALFTAKPDVAPGAEAGQAPPASTETAAATEAPPPAPSAPAAETAAAPAPSATTIAPPAARPVEATPTKAATPRPKAAPPPPPPAQPKAQAKKKPDFGF